MNNSNDDWIDFLMSRRAERRTTDEGHEDHVPVAARPREDGRRVPVVKDEAMVDRSMHEAADVQQLLEFSETVADPAIDPRHERRRCPDSHDAFEYVSADHATPTYLAVVGGRIKNRPTAELPEGEKRAPAVGEVADDAPVVVVIDTGAAQETIGRGAESNRDDGWLHRFTVLTDDDTDIDFLDEIPPSGLDIGAGHGTFVAGIIGRVTPAEILMVRAFDTDGIGTDAAIAAAVRRAGQLFRERSGGRGVLNMSFGVETVDNAEPDVLRWALEDLPPEVVVVAAAGNEKSGTPFWPATSKRALAVAALDEDMTPAPWSNFGPWVDFSTRGVKLIGPYVAGTESQGTGQPGDPFDEEPDTFRPPNPFAEWEGTSFAAAQVSGVVANLLLDNPTMTRGHIVSRLKQRAYGKYVHNYGYLLSILND